MSWAECVNGLAQKVCNDIMATPANIDVKAHNDDVNALKKQVSFLNTALKGKTWIVGDAPTLADILCGMTLMTSFQLLFDAGFRKGRADLGKWFESFIELP